MPPLEAIRALLGVLCILFAYFLGQSIAIRKRHGRRASRLTSWILRTAVTAMAVLWRTGLDRLAIAVLALAAAGATAGFYLAGRPRREQDLSHVMFPRE